MTLAQVEKRLEMLERQIEELKHQQNGDKGRTGKWYIEHAGQFKDDPVYAEIVRLGRKYRESLRPKPRRKKKR